MKLDPHEELKKKMRKAKRALKLANDVMSYCAGDRWERECTENDRKEFNKLYTEITGNLGLA